MMTSAEKLRSMHLLLILPYQSINKNFLAILFFSVLEHFIVREKFFPFRFFGKTRLLNT